MDFLTILMIIFLFIDLIIFLFAVKIIQRKGGLKFLKMFLSRKMKLHQVSNTIQVRLSQFATYPSTKYDIVFLGDSIFEGGSWFEFYPDLTCRNRAIGGNKTSDILARINPILASKPKKLFLHGGINDVLTKEPRNKVLKNYNEILNEIKTKSPNTKTYVMGVLPINKKKCNEILSPKKQLIIDATNEEINSLNNDIKNICDVTFIGDYSGLKDSSGECKPEYTYDGVHLTFEGYSVLSELLKTYVYEEIKD